MFTPERTSGRVLFRRRLEGKSKTKERKKERKKEREKEKGARHAARSNLEQPTNLSLASTHFAFEKKIISREYNSRRNFYKSVKNRFGCLSFRFERNVELFRAESLENRKRWKGRLWYALGSKRSQTDLVSEIADPGVSALYAVRTPIFQRDFVFLTLRDIVLSPIPPVFRQHRFQKNNNLPPPRPLRDNIP